MEVENSDPDVKAIYGANSPQWKEVLAEESKYGYPDLSGRELPGHHRALREDRILGVCSEPSLAAPDRLPSEPGGYKGYDALYGNVNVGKVIGGTPVLRAGRQGERSRRTAAARASTRARTRQDLLGFPGFDVSAAQTLGYVAAICRSTAFRSPTATSRMPTTTMRANSAAGPGQAAYVAQLKADDAAFGTFFTRLPARRHHSRQHALHRQLG